MNSNLFSSGSPFDMNTFVPSRDVGEKIVGLADRYHNDNDFRNRINKGDNADVIAEFTPPAADTAAGMNGLDFVLIADTDDVCHFVVAADPNSTLVDEQLMQVAGGGTASTAGSAGSASTWGCSCMVSTLSSLGSAACAGTAS